MRVVRFAANNYRRLPESADAAETVIVDVELEPTPTTVVAHASPTTAAAATPPTAAPASGASAPTPHPASPTPHLIATRTD